MSEHFLSDEQASDLVSEIMNHVNYPTKHDDRAAVYTAAIFGVHNIIDIYERRRKKYMEEKNGTVFSAIRNSFGES